MKSIRLLITALVALPLASAQPGHSASSWPHLRGPGLDGRTSVGIELPETPSLAVDWRIRLGSGYSGIAVAAGRAVTAFADGDADVVAAFDAATGREIWRHTLNPVTKGHDGSDDGPLSTPLIVGERVVFIGAAGRLVALGLEDGAVAWSKELPEEFGSLEPHFGFSTTPVLADGKLIVMTGGPEGKAVSALDPATGGTLWSVGTEKVDDQMPVAMELAGKLQIVAVAGKTLMGLDPQDGARLWSHDFGEGDWVGGSTPTYAGPNQFLVFASGDAVVYGVGTSDGEYAVSELYRSKALGGSYALPVYRDGYLYGFRGQILTCMNAGNGERKWRSREPGGRGLVLVDDKMVIFGANGEVVVADADPEGYRERARIEALETSSYTWPAFADGRILVRNLDQMAAVRLGSGSDQRVAMRPSAVSETPAGGFGAWVAELAALESTAGRSAAIDAYLEEHSQSPILGDGHAHFVYRGEAEDLAIQGTMLPTANPEPMEQVAGSDFFYKSVPVELGTRHEYRLIRDYEERMADPRNPHAAPASGGGGKSQFKTAGYELPGHTAEAPESSRGRLEDLSFESGTLGERELRIYLPAGYDQADERYPLLLVHDGLDWLEHGLMTNSLDNLIGKRSRPVVVAFLKPRDQWWLEAGGSGTDEHVAMLVDELLPLLAKRYRLTEGAGSHAVMGNLGYGLTSAYVALKHPELFGKVAIQSPQIGLGYEGAVNELLGTEAADKVTVYLDWNRYEHRDVDSGFDLYEESRRFADALAVHEVAYTGGEMNDSFGWAGWRSRTDRILETLFPLGD